MTLEKAKDYLGELQAKSHAYAHAMNVMYYDAVTVAPRGGASMRGRTMAFLSGESYKLLTSEETGEALDLLAAHREELTPAEARQTEILLKNLRELRRIPMEEYVAYQALLNDAEVAWHQAKESSNWATFAPFMEKILAANIRFAGLVAPEKDPYDYCLDQYEEGLTQEICDAFFAALRERIVPLLEKVKAAAQVEDGFLHTPVAVPVQEKLSGYLMDVMGIDREYCALGLSEHPFTTNFSRWDVRITTHYYEEAFASGMYSVIHEGGHALYELHTAEDLQGSVLAEGCSMAMHESQSRFYENILGRSRAFINCIYPRIAELVPAVAEHTPEELYRAVNRAEPSLIRTEADELTYSLHVLIRYEIEKKLMHGELAVCDLPAEWNRLYKEYLGVEVPDDRHGALQDSHWSGGAIGYFPSYALGSAYGAQIRKKMEEDVDVDACLAAGDMSPVSAWLEEHIWRHGRMFRPVKLLEDVLGEPFDPSYYTAYLERKFGEIYGL